MEWQPFWDTFCSLIDQNDCLTDMDKFTYLRSTLVGGAADVVRGLPLVGSNYQAAIACLKERYDDTQRIISAHMDALLNMAAIMNDHDIAGMRHLYDGVMNHTRSLQALGRSTENCEKYGDMFVPILLQNIPKGICLDVCKRATNDTFSLDELLENLKIELKSRARCDNSAGIHPQAPRHQRHHGSVPPTAALLTTTGTPQPVSCVFCSDGHASAHCTVITNTAKRREVLSREGRCCLCLRKYHTAGRCRSRTRCRTCNGRHHQAICERGQATGAARTSHDTAETMTSRNTHETTTVTMSSTSTESALLQTAKAVASSPKSHMTGTVRLLFDGGCQRSYVTEETASAAAHPPSRAAEN